jgi:hypothetical protein
MAKSFEKSPRRLSTIMINFSQTVMRPAAHAQAQRHSRSGGGCPGLKSKKTVSQRSFQLQIVTE